MKRVSLADVADALGVSKTLVSLVLNGRGDEKGISKDTQKRVHEKVKELNYKPNQFARGLRIGKSNTIGLIVADISNSFYAKICRSVEDAAASKGYNVIICSSDENHEREKALIQMLRERQVDGLIVASTLSNTEEFKEFKKDGFPFVLIDRHFSDINSNYVVVDNREGAKNAMNHLIGAGYQNIACFSISPAYISSIVDRIDGCKDALEEHGMKGDDLILKEIPFDGIQAGVERSITEILNGNPKADAIFALNNTIAIACLRELKKKGIRIPEHLALMSFDDRESFELCSPTISAVAQPIHEIGEEATTMLLANIEKKGTPWQNQHVTLTTELIVRDSG